MFSYAFFKASIFPSFLDNSGFCCLVLKCGNSRLNGNSELVSIFFFPLHSDNLKNIACLV